MTSSATITMMTSWALEYKYNDVISKWSFSNSLMIIWIRSFWLTTRSIWEPGSSTGKLLLKNTPSELPVVFHKFWVYLLSSSAWFPRLGTQREVWHQCLTSVVPGRRKRGGREEGMEGGMEGGREGGMEDKIVSYEMNWLWKYVFFSNRIQAYLPRVLVWSLGLLGDRNPVIPESQSWLLPWCAGSDEWCATNASTTLQGHHP